jgi:hypothetical protein
VEVTADPFDDTLESPDVEEKGSDVTWRDIGIPVYNKIFIKTIGTGMPLIVPVH